MRTSRELHGLPRSSRTALENLALALAACTISACALTAAGLVGLDILRKTFDGVTSKNYGDKYKDDADNLFQTMAKPVSEKVAASGATTAAESTKDSKATEASHEAKSAEASHQSKSAEASQDSKPADSASSSSSVAVPQDTHPDSSAKAASGESADSGVATGAGASLTMEVALMKEEIIAGRSIPVPIQDGDALYDRFGTHGQGDNIKFMFRTSTPAYVYVISIDGTGWIQPVFPGIYSGLTNPVQPNKTYLFPEGSSWAQLDSYRGVEHLYFIASRARRADLEKALAPFATHVRDVDRSRIGADPAEVAQVQNDAPLSRGFDAPRKSVVPDIPSSTGETFHVDAQLFGSIGNGNILVTRWFRHQ
jgi:hypothetical protein